MPTQLLQPGEITKLFDANPLGSPPVNSAVFALPTTLAKVITWTYWFSAAPSAASIKLQVSNNVNGPWTDLDPGILTTGETRTSPVTDAAFLRAQKTSQTGAGDLTVEVTFGY